MTRVLTGIKPSGTPHIGNLLGAIRPAIALANQGLEAMYFIADYHAMTTVQPANYKDAPAMLRQQTREVAATWLACGLDPSKTLFYRQSAIPEIFEMAWIFSCLCTKGWMEKAHAYKSIADEERESVNVGVYTYPILMAADIIAFDIDLVPVGKDQVQHVEIARDIAQRINHQYKQDVLRLPTAKVGADSAVVPGIDGKKMSKSYDNVIPIFGDPKKLEKAVKSIATDSTPPEAPKDPETSTIFQIYRAVASAEETAELAARYRAGIGWGDAKKILAARIEQEVAPARDKYNALLAEPQKLDALLAEGAVKARKIAAATLARLRAATGIDEPVTA